MQNDLKFLAEIYKLGYDALHYGSDEDKKAAYELLDEIKSSWLGRSQDHLNLFEDLADACVKIKARTIDIEL